MFLRHGGSGRNVGLVNAGLWLPPQDVVRKLGETKGANLVAALGDAPETVFSLIERHQIQCEATRAGTIHAAHSPKGFAELARRAEKWQRLGAPVELLSSEAAAEKIGSAAFFGGLFDRRAGTINPMGYVRGLARAARAARAAGARITTDAAVKESSRDSGRWILRTDRGTVTSNTVVLGTNAYTDDLWPGLKRTFTPINYFQLASVPLGSRVDGILDESQGQWDTGTIMFSLRRDAFGRIVIGSIGTAIGGVDGLSSRWARRTLSRSFPRLGRVDFESAWHGQIAMTPDHLPRIHRLADGLYTPIGYNGRGIAPGTVFGKAMADLLAGGREEDLPLPVPDLGTVHSAPILSRLYQAAFTARQILKSM